jgi:hypothetical protein
MAVIFFKFKFFYATPPKDAPKKVFFATCLVRHRIVTFLWRMGLCATEFKFLWRDFVVHLPCATKF